MDAKKCDRCGEFYINNTVGINCTTVNRLYLAQYYPDSRPNKIMDLCCDCKHDLDEWFNKFKKEEQNDECEEM